METILALDLGTTNCKLVAIQRDGEPRFATSVSYELSSPHPGRVEQDPGAVWSAVLVCLAAAAHAIPGADLAGLCLSGAMHSLLPVDRRGKPLTPALTWADGRAAGQAERLRLIPGANNLYQRTGCPLQPPYFIPRLRWFMEEAPQVAAQAACFCHLKDWILFQLTGVWAGDLSIYSSTGLLDIRRLDWDELALSFAGISPQQLPPLVPPRQEVGGLLSSVSQKTGLPSGLPVIAGAADGGLANLGAGALGHGRTVITVGTSAAVRRVVSQPWLDERQRTWCYLLSPGLWYAGGAINNAGLAVRWVRERFYPDLLDRAGFDQLFADAETILPGSEGVTLLPYFTGERSPLWNSNARAVLAGLGLSHTRAHVARAVLESVAFCLADVMEALGDAGQEPVLLTGSIVHSRLWSQILADVLGVPLLPVDAADASAIGAGLIGLWGLGLIPSLEEAVVPRTGQVLLPDASAHRVYQQAHQNFQALYIRTFVQ